MGAVGAYIVSVACAAVLCGILTAILPEKGASASLLRLIIGVFLAFVAIRPLTRVELSDLPAISDGYLKEAEAVSAEGGDLASEAMAAIIKAETEAYILDKAKALDTEIAVEVTLSTDAVPSPVAVRVSGAVSPYAKTQLQELLENDLGIAKEDQEWIG